MAAYYNVTHYNIIFYSHGGFELRGMKPRLGTWIRILRDTNPQSLFLKKFDTSLNQAKIKKMKKNWWIGLGIVVVGFILYFSGLGKFLQTSMIFVPETVTLETNLGDIEIRLLPEEAPKLARNFAELAKAGKYNGTIFHRVIKGFMIQGGDFENADGTGGTSSSGKELKDEFSQNLSHVRGAVSMANHGPDTNGSQFFIVQEDAQFLDGRHSIIGQVTSGMDTVDRIAEEKTDLNDRPINAVTILRVRF